MVGTQEKAKERDDLAKMIDQYMPIIMSIFSNSKSKAKGPDKSDFVVHHVIKFEK